MSESLESSPSFELRGKERIITHESLKGSKSILVFYPEDDTRVCTNQLALYNEILPMFEEYNAQVFGISVDDLKTHEKFSSKLNLKFDLLSDDDPKGAVSKKFNVYDEEHKISKRALFVLDEDGNIAWSQVVPYNVNPGADGILKALEKLKKN